MSGGVVVVVCSDDPHDVVAVQWALKEAREKLRQLRLPVAVALRPDVAVSHAFVDAKGHEWTAGEARPVSVHDAVEVVAPLRLTFQEAAAALRTSVKTVRRRVDAGLLPAARDGRQRYIDPADLATYVAEQQERQ